MSSCVEQEDITDIFLLAGMSVVFVECRRMSLKQIKMNLAKEC